MYIIDNWERANENVVATRGVHGVFDTTTPSRDAWTTYGSGTSLRGNLCRGSSASTLIRQITVRNLSKPPLLQLSFLIFFRTPPTEPLLIQPQEKPPDNNFCEKVTNYSRCLKSTIPNYDNKCVYFLTMTISERIYGMYLLSAPTSHWLLSNTFAFLGDTGALGLYENYSRLYENLCFV